MAEFIVGVLVKALPLLLSPMISVPLLATPGLLALPPFALQVVEHCLIILVVVHVGDEVLAVFVCSAEICQESKRK